MAVADPTEQTSAGARARAGGARASGDASAPAAVRADAMPARRLTLVLAVAQVLAAALLLGFVELALLFSGTEEMPAWVAALFVFGAWVYAGAGAIAWLRRPGSLMGLLMTAGAFAWLLAGLGNVGVPLLVAAGKIGATVPVAVLIHLLLAFPSGRLRDRRARATAIAGYVVCLVGQAPLYLFAPGGPLSIADRADLADAGQWVQRGCGLLVVIATSALLAERLRAAAPAQRRVLAPLALYGIVAVLVIPVGGALGDLLGDPVTRAVVQLTIVAGVPVAFVVAASRGGFARTGEIEELGAQLGDGGRAELSDVLAATLGDATVELLFRVPGERGWVSEAGVFAVPPAASARRGVVEVELAGETIGAIVYDATLLRRQEVQEAGRVLALALDRERLTVELRASRARLVEAGDAERRRIARDLHDGLQSRLVLLAVQAGVAADDARAAEGGGDGGHAQALAEVRRGVETAIDELRALVHGVMPAELTERGLAAAVEALADRMPVAVALELGGGADRLPPAVESTGYFVVSEALVNAVKHARAAELEVALALLPGERLLIEVRDDGIGGATIDRAGHGHGMRSIADRVEALGGVLRIDSATGAGTRLTVELPCAS